MGANSTTKFLKNVAGTLAEFFAITTSSGASDADKVPALNASGVLDDSIVNASNVSANNKLAKMNASGILDDTILNASATSAANKVVKMNGSGIIAPTILNAKVVSAGAGDSGKLPQLDASGKLDNSVLPTGVGAETVQALASEAIGAGDFVNIYTNAGVANVRKADASTTGKEANGFVNAAVASAATATVFVLSNINTSLTGLTPGAIHFLSPTVPGGVTATPPTAAGQVCQQLGRATGTTTLAFQPGPAVTIA